MQCSNNLSERRRHKESEFDSNLKKLKERFANCYNAKFESINKWISYLEEEEADVAFKLDKVEPENSFFSRKLRARLTALKSEITHNIWLAQSILSDFETSEGELLLDIGRLVDKSCGTLDKLQFSLESPEIVGEN